MAEWSRRSLLRVSAGAAVAVPMAALGSTRASAGTRAAAAAGTGPTAATNVAASTADGPVMFCVHDAQRGEVSILHGSNEVIVRDRQLVARILTAAGSARA
jgi:hypothetical protein